jgi:flagellar biosynthesis/type III secretory pathway M-ring protein FliF/YscJ
MSESTPNDTTPRGAQEEEWPPREWRETTRAAGRRQAMYVALGMVVIFAVIVVIAIWASRNG